jgi:SAM-dependent methyltransferase
MPDRLAATPITKFKRKIGLKMTTNSLFFPRLHCPACESRETRECLRVSYDDPAMTDALQRLYADVGRYEPAATSGGHYIIRRCTHCQLLFQAEVPSPALMDAVYGDWHHPEKTRSHLVSIANPERALHVAREVSLAWQLARAPGHALRILDYGCGLGPWAGMAVAFGAETWGVELSPERREHCARLGIRMVSPPELPPAYFDYIQLDQVLKHLVEPLALLRSLVNHLRPGGVICVAVPSARCVPARLPHWREEFARRDFGALMPIEPLLHLNGFNHHNLRVLGLRCGLEPLNPPWRLLLQLWAPGASPRALLKSLALPFYLRSRLSTRLYFRRPASSAP